MYQMCLRAQSLVGGRGGTAASVLGLLQTLGVAGLAVRVDWLGVAGAVLDDVVFVDSILLIAL
jgi:hypothetical protein